MARERPELPARDSIEEYREIGDYAPPRPKCKIPQSLLTAAGRIHFGRVVELFRKIREDCDAEAASLGFKFPRDDGLAAVKFIADELLKAVQKERLDERKPHRKSGPHEFTKRFLELWDFVGASHGRAWRSQEIENQLKSKADIKKWIANLKDDLRRGATKAGNKLMPHEVEAITRYIGDLEERIAKPERKKTKKDVKEQLAISLLKFKYLGKPPLKMDDPIGTINEKVKRARASVRHATRRTK
jgi:hypothetical protein